MIQIILVIHIGHLKQIKVPKSLTCMNMDSAAADPVTRLQTDMNLLGKNVSS